MNGHASYRTGYPGDDGTTYTLGARAHITPKRITLQGTGWRFDRATGRCVNNGRTVRVLLAYRLDSDAPGTWTLTAAGEKEPRP